MLFSDNYFWLEPFLNRSPPNSNLGMKYFKYFVHWSARQRKGLHSSDKKLCLCLKRSAFTKAPIDLECVGIQTQTNDALMNLSVICSLSSFSTEMDKWPDKQVALMFQLYDALASAESLLALQACMCVCECVCIRAYVCVWEREIRRTLALLFRFDLSHVGATLQCDTS